MATNFRVFQNYATQSSWRSCQADKNSMSMFQLYNLLQFVVHGSLPSIATYKTQDYANKYILLCITDTKWNFYTHDSAVFI